MLKREVFQQMLEQVDNHKQTNKWTKNDPWQNFTPMQKLILNES